MKVLDGWDQLARLMRPATVKKWDTTARFYQAVDPEMIKRARQRIRGTAGT